MSRTSGLAPRIVVSALGSSSGKTTIAAGLLGALRARGLKVAGYKVGPDFLDPQVLSAATAGGIARNLDPWLTTPARMLQGFQRTAPRGGRALSVIEGMMGLLDATAWGSSTLDVARRLRAPILLVLDASAASESLAVMARGAREVLRNDHFAGVVLNRVGGPLHERAVRKALEAHGGVPVLGALPWERGSELPKRHLGLATPTTDPRRRLVHRVRAAADLVARHVDLDAVVRSSLRAAPLPEPPESSRRAPARTSEGRGAGPPAPTLAVAQDAAFCFLYPEGLEAFTDAGARVRPFSPLRGESLPPGTDAVYLPGGYPELHAAQIARNRSLLAELRGWVRDGRPLYAECGGMMVLLDRLVDPDGRLHRMAGAFPGSTRMSDRLGGFGYARAVTRRPSVLGPKGTRLRGHRFHHSVRTLPGSYPWGLSCRGSSREPMQGDGYVQGSAFASYLHLRLDAYPAVVERLLGRA